jgi:uncharacterized protein YbdZ (MbtH family)
MTQPIRTNGYTEAERLKMCASKRRYSDELAARAGGMISLEKQDTGYSKLWPYRCDVCRGWHLSKKKRPDVAPITINQAVAA